MVDEHEEICEDCVREASEPDQEAHRQLALEALEAMKREWDATHPEQSQGQ